MAAKEQSLLQHACCVCGQQADIVISDCQNREPVEAHGKLFIRRKRRGEVKGYCYKHARPPRLFGVNGKLLEEVVTNG